MSPKLIGQLVNRRTGRALGRDLSPRLLRKLIPTELAINDPEHVGVAQPLLGHADYRTTQRAYNLGRALDAARRHHGVLRSIRATGAAPRQDSRGVRPRTASTKQRRRPRLGTRNSPKRG